MVKLNIDLPESFFKEEERDGYLVSAKMKELWAVQLDLLNEFDRVCKKHNLKYVLEGGTLLGAIRHKGYIPWDDDVDVSMLREDYDKLMEVGPKEFKNPYFFQNHRTDKKFEGGAIKLRRTDTTCFTSYNLEHHVTYNQGIYIDVFVYDRIPDDKYAQEYLHQECWFAHYLLDYMSHKIKYSGDSILKTLAKRFYYRLQYGSLERMYRRWVGIAKRFEHSDYDVVGSLMFFNLHCRSRKSFEKTIEVPFEFFKFSVPENYDEVLSDCYGDYMTPVMGTSVHSLVFFDTDRSYKDILADKMTMKEIYRKLLC